MTTLLPGRLSLIGALLFCAGLYFTVRFSSGCIRMLYRKFRKGRSYLKGSASDYAWFAVASLVATLAGAWLLAAASLQSGMQPFEGTKPIGTVRVTNPESGRIHLTLELGETHPGGRALEADLPGLRWALEGEFLQWNLAPHWMGFGDGHRVEAVLGTATESGAPDRREDSRAIVAGVYAPWHWAYRHGAWIPSARTSLRRTPWISGDPGTYQLIVTDAGYVLVSQADMKEEGESERPHPEDSGKR